MNCPHGLRQSLVFPGPALPRKIPVKALAADLQNPAVQGYPALPLAAVRLFRNEPHSLFLADFLRLAAKKALASAKNSFSSLSRRLAFSSSFTCLRSTASSSARLIAVSGAWLPGPASSRPSRTAFCQPYNVSSGMPSSCAASPAPISFPASPPALYTPSRISSAPVPFFTPSFSFYSTPFLCLEGVNFICTTSAVVLRCL